jgi:hypothetical protein
LRGWLFLVNMALAPVVVSPLASDISLVSRY